MTDGPAARRLVPRRFGRLVGRKLYCPDDKLRNWTVRYGDQHLPLMCAHNTDAPRVCDVHWLYLLPADDGGTLVVECTEAEVLDIAARRLGASEIRRFLAEGQPLEVRIALAGGKLPGQGATSAAAVAQAHPLHEEP